MVDTISKCLTLKPLVSFVKLLYPLLLTTSQPGGHLNNTVNTVSVLISPHHQILDSSTQLFKVKPFLCTDLFAKPLTHFHFCPQTKISSHCQTPATYPPLLWSCTALLVPQINLPGFTKLVSSGQSTSCHFEPFPLALLVSSVIKTLGKQSEFLLSL